MLERFVLLKEYVILTLNGVNASLIRNEDEEQYYKVVELLKIEEKKVKGYVPFWGILWIN